MHPHARQYFFPSLAKIRHFVGARFDLRWRIGFTIAKFAIQTQRDLRRCEAIPDFPEDLLDVILKACHADSFPQGPGRRLGVAELKLPIPP